MNVNVLVSYTKRHALIFEGVRELKKKMPVNDIQENNILNLKRCYCFNMRTLER